MAVSEKLGSKAKLRNTLLALALTGATNGPIQVSRQIEEDVFLSAPTVITPAIPYFPSAVKETASAEAIPANNFFGDRLGMVDNPRPVAKALVSEPSLILTPLPTRMVEQIEEAETPEAEIEIRRPIYWGNRNRPEVALTFDDGFSYQAIKKTLEVLAAHNVTGTFFVIGSQLRAHASLWQEAVAAGHEVCNHTYSHRYLASLTSEQIKMELAQWEEAAEEVLGEEYVTRMKQEFAYLRFPGGSGHNDEKVLRAVTEAGYWPIAWSAETYAAVLKNHDLKNDPVAPIAQEVSGHIVGSSRNGTIILLHFNSWDTLYLDSTVRGIINKGLQPTTVSDVLKE